MIAIGLAGVASDATIMHGMKIDVKRKIYLVSIEKIDSKSKIPTAPVSAIDY